MVGGVDFPAEEAQDVGDCGGLAGEVSAECASDAGQRARLAAFEPDPRPGTRFVKKFFGLFEYSFSIGAKHT